MGLRIDQRRVSHSVAGRLLNAAQCMPWPLVKNTKSVEAFQVHAQDNMEALGPTLFASNLSRPNSRVDDRSMSVGCHGKRNHTANMGAVQWIQAKTRTYSRL